jgi:CMP-N,N'-diacetyllegionaminic acid synthase
MIAIIPARGGSKGLPGKNIRLLDGIPLIAHTIHAALNAEGIRRVIISTDNHEIASIARDNGAEVPFMRPLDLAKDNSMVIDSYLYTIDWLAKDEGEKIDSFVALLPTAPLRNSNDIDSAIKFFNDKNAGSVISVVEAPVPMEWYKKIDSQGILRNLLEKKAGLKNRQEFKSQFVPNGAIYIFNTERLRSTREYYNEKTFPYVMPPERSADIDNLIDFKWAEFLLTHQ